MSVINDSQAGDELICLEEFTGPPIGVRPGPETSRTFRVGERVRYVSFYRDQNLHDNPVCWMVIFDAANGKRYAATQTYFVTEDCWQGLKKFFAKRLLREPKKQRSP
jgi:hypothetical protein